MDQEIKVLERLYTLFNQRDIDAVLQQMTDDIMWANGMEGGHVIGHQGVRDYWTRQWQMIDPLVEPVAFQRQGDAILVEVRQSVRTLDGEPLEGQTNRPVGRLFRFRDGKVARFDIC
jgi:ketosteroid isomerase-like protein